MTQLSWRRRCTAKPEAVELRLEELDVLVDNVFLIGRNNTVATKSCTELIVSGNLVQDSFLGSTTYAPSQPGTCTKNLPSCRHL